MNIHFIAIGGAAMHNLAIALHQKGYKVTGSDDEIFEPSKGRLDAQGLLPESTGWFPEKIHENLDAVILGMHARQDNTELLKAKELGLKIYSYPEYLYEQSKNKKRIVIAGSHGKTTITAMILHVLQQCDIACDYMVGAQLDGFDVMVKLTDNAPYMIIEGDEYLTSPIDLRPKFHLYNPDIAVISGIAWDHINVFPTFENYMSQFEIFISMISKQGTLFYFEGDQNLKNLAINAPDYVNAVPYTYPDFTINNNVTSLNMPEGNFILKVFGKHNLANIMAAYNVCIQLGVEAKVFFNAISSFNGASKRLELVLETTEGRMYKDFAHAPSKLKATLDAIRTQYPHALLIACLELHTFSSLNKDFLPLYANTMNNADVPCVYYNPHTLAHKKLPPLSKESVRKFFNNDNLLVFDNSVEMLNYISTAAANTTKKRSILMMSSGNFDGLDFNILAANLLN